MLATILFYSFGGFVSILSEFLPVWSPWPAELLNGFTAMGTALMKLNFFLPIYEWLYTAIWFSVFIGIWYTAKLLLMIINFFRGKGAIDV